MSTSWRIVPLETHTAFFNMAADEAISEGVAAGTSLPTIRFYTWKPGAVSIGYFQGLHREVNSAACEAKGVDIVRRRTGGGAVYHDTEGEITYSVIAPENFFPKDIIASYREICGWIVDALAILGLEAGFHPINDILVKGKKISGNAQTRRGGVLLQHGTLLLNVDVETMFSLLLAGEEKISDKMIQDVRQRVTSIAEHANLSRDVVWKALETAFTKNKTWQRGELTAQELHRAYQLASERYGKREWNWMR